MYCENDPNYECTHTADLTYAKNWDHQPTDEELRLYFQRYGQHLADPDFFEKDDRDSPIFMANVSQ